ncbi:MAG: DUF3293 domain-containing protein [Lysobacter sp.]|nr:DUF3293 domain-containing protein [Lysobacter sp.]
MNQLSYQDVTEAPPLPPLATLAAIYTAAGYKWEIDGRWWPIQIGEHARELDDAFPDATRFGMLSASNPGNFALNDAENRSADRELQRALDQLGLRYRPGFVMGRNRSWRAQNWLVIEPGESTFDALARRFGQIGTLLWPREAPVRLRMRAARPEMLVEQPYIDWLGDGFCAASAKDGAIPALST